MRDTEFHVSTLFHPANDIAWHRCRSKIHSWTALCIEFMVQLGMTYVFGVGCSISMNLWLEGCVGMLFLLQSAGSVFDKTFNIRGSVVCVFVAVCRSRFRMERYETCLARYFFCRLFVVFSCVVPIVLNVLLRVWWQANDSGVLMLGSLPWLSWFCPNPDRFSWFKFYVLRFHFLWQWLL